MPGRPSSHIALDFVTGLPLCQGNDTILTIVDRFSKAVHFVALPKLPSATEEETAQLLVDHVFRIHGIPADIVSDRGPQFRSGVWKEFCQALGATVSLSSDITCSPTVRRREPIRIWRQRCTAYALRTLLHGVLTSPGSNTHTTPFLQQLQV